MTLASEAQVKKIYALAKKGKLWDSTKERFLTVKEISRDLWRPLPGHGSEIKMLKSMASFYIETSENKENNVK